METNKEDFPHYGYHIYFEKNSKKHDKNNMFYATCNLCSPSKKPLSVSFGTASNLRKHVNVSVFYVHFIYLVVLLTLFVCLHIMLDFSSVET